VGLPVRLLGLRRPVRGIAFTGVFAIEASDHGIAESVWPVIGLALFAGVLALGGVWMRHMRVTIDDAAIEYVEWLKPRRLLLQQIRGYRRVKTVHGTIIVFEPRQPGGKKLKVPWVGTDAAFQAWLARVPDLDAAASRERTEPLQRGRREP
jgi:hypothetical protein